MEQSLSSARTTTYPSTISLPSKIRTTNQSLISLSLLLYSRRSSSLVPRCLLNANNQCLIRSLASAFNTTIANGSKEDRLKMRLPNYLRGSNVTFAPSVLQDGETIGQMALLRSTRGLPKRRGRLDCIEMILFLLPRPYQNKSY